MTKTTEQTQIRIAIKTSTNSNLSRHTIRLSNQNSSVTATSSMKKCSLGSLTTTRVPFAIDRRRGQPVASLSSSPISPSVSNGRTSTTSDSVSERSIAGSVLKSAPIDEKKPKIELAGSKQRTCTLNRPKSTPTTSLTTDAGPCKSRSVSHKVPQSSSVLPKFVIKSKHPSTSGTSITCRDKNSNANPNSKLVEIRQLKQPTNIRTIIRATPTGPILTSKHKVLSSCGRSIYSTGNELPKSSFHKDGRLNNLVAVVHPQQQQDKQEEDVPSTCSNATTNANADSLESVGESQIDYKARTIAEEASATIKLKATQQEEKSEGDRSEAAYPNHKDVNGPTAASTAATKAASNRDCLSNNLRARQDERERLCEKGEISFVSGHDFSNATNERKQLEDGQESSGTAEELIEGTTSGQIDKDVPNEIRANFLLPATSRERPSVANSTVFVSSLSKGSKPTSTLKTKTLTTRRNDKNDQFVSATDSQTASSSNVSIGSPSDKKQHEKQQQINKCPPGKHRSMLSQAHTRMPKLQQKLHESSADGYKCLHKKLDTKSNNLQQPPRSHADSSQSKHEIASDSLCFKTDSTKSSSSSATTTDLVRAVDAHSINSHSHVLSKPMGHQVLSLMMLDAGLLPASKDQPTNERNSHVCLQSEPSLLKQNRLLDFSIQDDVSLDSNNNNDAAKTSTKSNASFQMSANHRLGKAYENNLYPDDLDINNSLCREQATIQIDCTEKNLKQIDSINRSTNHHSFSSHLKDIHSTSISLPSSPRLSRAQWPTTSTQSPLNAMKCCKFNLNHEQLIDQRQNRRQATGRWISSVRNCSTPLVTHEFNSSKKNDTFNDETKLRPHSVTSSCSSLNNHCPPMLSLSNQLDTMDLSKLIKDNLSGTNREMDDSHQHGETQIKPSTIVVQVDLNKDAKVQQRNELDVRLRLQSLSQIRMPHSQVELCYPFCKDSDNNHSSKIDRSDEFNQLAGKKRKELISSDSNESEFELFTQHDSELKLEKKSSITAASTRRDSIKTNNETNLLFGQNKSYPLGLQSSRRQPRSNSISGQEFHHLVGEHHNQRLNQPNHMLHSPYVDSSQYYNNKMRDHGSSHYSHNLTTDRSLSPSNFNGRTSDFYIPKRSSSIKYPLDKPLTRNHIHASLECLNNSYADYGQHSPKPHASTHHQIRQYPQQQNQQIFQHHPTFQNNHYATTYVLAAAPPDTVVNHNTEQDLAAAAMAAPQHYNPMLSSESNLSSTKMNNVKQSSQTHNHYHTQGLFNNRAAAPMSQSPLHRRLVHGPMASILNQITSSSSNPLRPGHSSLSLASSTYLIEDKLQNEIKQLQSELKSEKEKNDALNSQLNINSNLMAAFEQSLTTLNNRLRQMTALNERKDKEIDELRNQLGSSDRLTLEPSRVTSEKSTSPICAQNNNNDSVQIDTELKAQNYDSTCKPMCHEDDLCEQTTPQDKQLDGQNFLKIIEDLKRQLIEKDRLLTDTRLEALSAAHQLEQLESRLNGEQSMLANEDDLDEGVMVVNHSPSDSDAITDSTHFNDHQHRLNKTNLYEHNNSLNANANQQNRYRQANYRNKIDNNNLEDMMLFTPQGHHTSSESHAGGLSSNSNHSNDDTNEILQPHRQQDNQSDRSSSDYHDDDRSPGDTTSQQEFGAANLTSEQTFESREEELMNKMLDKLLVGN